MIKSLDQATEPGPGQALELQAATAHHTMIVSVEGVFTSCVVILEGSHDGTLWAPMGTAQLSGETSCAFQTTQPTAHLVTWVRARLGMVTGSRDAESPQVTATIASADH